ncbi:hypothetical protein AM593_08544, partial [Mytilus galloprovincialis]
LITQVVKTVKKVMNKTVTTKQIRRNQTKFLLLM